MNRFLSEIIYFFKKKNVFGVTLVLLIFSLLFVSTYPVPPKASTALSYDMTTYFNAETHTFNASIYAFNGQGYSDGGLQINYNFYLESNSTVLPKFSGSGTTNSNGYLILSYNIQGGKNISYLSLEYYNLTYSNGYFSTNSEAHSYNEGKQVINPYFVTCVFGQTNLEDRSLVLAYLSPNLSGAPHVSLTVENSTGYFGPGNVQYGAQTLIGNYSGFTHVDIHFSKYLLNGQFFFFSLNIEVFKQNFTNGVPLYSYVINYNSIPTYSTAGVGTATDLALFFMVFLFIWFTEDYFMKPVKDGTMESVISKPVGRREIYLLRFFAVVIGSLIVLLIDFLVSDLVFLAFTRTFVSAGAFVGTFTTLFYFVLASTSITFMLSTFGGRKLSNKVIFLFIFLITWIYGALVLIDSGFISLLKVLSPAYKSTVTILTIIQYGNPFTLPYLFNDIITKSILIPSDAYGPLYDYGINPIFITIVAAAWIVLPFVLGYRRMKNLDF